MTAEYSNFRRCTPRHCAAAIVFPFSQDCVISARTTFGGLIAWFYIPVASQRSAAIQWRWRQDLFLACPINSL